MWKDILKLQIQQGGYAQLDFDNIMEEDDNDCKRRWQQICDKLRRVEIEGFATERSDSITYYMVLPEDNPSSSEMHLAIKYANFGQLFYDYGSEIPEEVYCAALDLLGTDRADKDVGEFNIFRYKRENEVGATNLVSILPKSGIVSEYKSGKTLARIGYTTTPRNDLDVLPRLREKIKTVLPKLKEAFPY
jgi:hypothetical protein